MMVLAVTACLLGAASVAAEEGGERADASVSVEAVAVAQERSEERMRSWPEMAGRWAQKQVTTSVTRVPIVGEVRSETETLLLLEIVQRGEELEVTTDVCDITISNRPNLVRTIIPEAFVRSLGRTTRRATLAWAGEHVRFEQPRFTEVIGARLSDPEREALPESAEDPRVVDQDGTGSPGVTVRIGGMVSGDVYVVQRGWSRLVAERVTSERFDGTVEWDNEQVVLGASNAFIRRDSPAHPDPSPTRNWFRTSRVESGASCTWLRRNEQQVFAR